ncbi:MAG: ABC transporter permease [Clostridiales bacterium]|nr:ABC transporter permease [Clostridiales bacterium]
MFDNVWTIARKNLSKSSHLKSRVSRLTVAACILFIVVVILYGSSFFMGAEYAPIWGAPQKEGILIVNAPDSFLRYTESESRIDWNFAFAETDAYYDFIGINRLLQDHSAYMAIVFPTDFDEQIFSETQNDRPQILSYYDPDQRIYKSDHDNNLEYISEKYDNFLLNEKGLADPIQPPFHIAADEHRLSDYSTMEDGMKKYIARSIVPLLIFIAALFLAMESGVVAIAGEKENGTFAALLLTPASKMQIVLGNTLGVFLRTLFPCTAMALLAMVGLSVFNIAIILSTILIVMSLVLILSSLIIAVSILNRTILAAQTAFLPVFLILLVVCVMAMNESVTQMPVYYMIPFFGHFLGIASALAGTYSIANLLILLSVSVGISFVMILISERLLHLEQFTTTNEASSDYREKREQARLKNPRKNYPEYPRFVIFGYRATRWRNAFRLLSYHFTLPLLLLSIFQPIALIAPILLFLRTGESTAAIDSLASLIRSFRVESAAKAAFEWLALMMREQSFIIGMAISYIIIILVYLFIVKGIEKNPLSTMGLPLKGKKGIRHAVFSYARGLIIGLSMITGVYLILLLTGQIKAEGFAMTSSALPLFFSYVLMWLPQGASEEIMMRGYMMPRIAVRFGKAGAVGLTSLLFGILHAGNIGFTPLALVNLILIAVFFALLSCHTGEIFTVCAAHSAWNFAQGNLFGLHVSGSPAPAAILSTNYTDGARAWITGGDFGPEGGLAVTLVSVAAIAILVMVSRKATRSRIS